MMNTYYINIINEIINYYKIIISSVFLLYLLILFYIMIKNKIRNKLNNITINTSKNNIYNQNLNEFNNRIMKNKDYLKILYNKNKFKYV